MLKNKQEERMLEENSTDAEDELQLTNEENYSSGDDYFQELDKVEKRRRGIALNPLRKEFHCFNVTSTTNIYLSSQPINQL